MNKQPLVLSFVGTESCNTGHVLSLESQIEPFLEDLRFVVKDS